MEVTTNIPLKDFTTMRLGGPARFMATATSAEEIEQLIIRAHSQQLPYLVLGGGSNIVFEDAGFSGIIILNRIEGFDIVSSDNGDTVIKIGAGENWDAVVKKTVEMGLSGIECMSGIPGTVGATPVQNVGAYGQEIADTLVELDAYDTKTNTFVKLPADVCEFSYRTSRFKNPATRHHIITSVTLRLNQTPTPPPFYASLQKYLDEKQITLYTPQVLRDAVIAIRANTLPDPSIYPNSGSFFRNPIIEKWQYDDLLQSYPDMPSFPMDSDHVKIPAGWLIDQAGLKDYSAHGCKTHEKNALVIINVSAESTNDLNAFKQEIQDKIRDMYRISLLQEPEQL